MDKKRAIELLKQALGEILSLKEKHYDNQDFKLWVSKISNIIDASLEKDDYDTFSSAWPRYFLNGGASDSRHFERYQEEIEMREIAIKKILQKYEILGIEEEAPISIAPEEVFKLVPPKAFISHGHGGGALLKLEKFIRELGVEPIIVKDQPNADRTVDGKVTDYLNEADFVIIFATGDDVIKGKDKDIRQPRQNVIHEIGLAQKIHPGKIIYLLEERAEFPSNIKPKVYESFARQSLDDSFTAIVREMRNWGFLRVQK